jgi:hypothetical protein
MVYRVRSEAEAREPDPGIDVESRASSEVEAQEPDLGIDLGKRTLTGFLVLIIARKTISYLVVYTINVHDGEVES